MVPLTGEVGGGQFMERYRGGAFATAARLSAASGVVWIIKANLLR